MASPDVPETDPVRCATCGVAAPGDEAGSGRASAAGPAAPITWTRSVEGAHVRLICPRCTREHLRNIEGKLDSDWW